MTPRQHVAPVLLAVLVLCLPGGRDATAGPRTPRRPPTLVLASPAGRARMVEADVLAFAFYERLYHKKSTSKEESLARQRVVIEDRRQECRCIRFEDWTRVKFKKLRQIEISYPPDGRAARLRLTERDGSIRSVPAERLHGAGGPLAPRFSATVDGVVREYRLVLADPQHDRWPDERLVRVRLKLPAEKRARRR